MHFIYMSLKYNQLKITIIYLKKVISFLIVLMFIFINFSHNAVMAFSSNEMVHSMWNHNFFITDSNKKIENCHTNSMEDCTSICCYDKDNLNITANSISNKSIKKKIDKIKSSYLDISLSSNLVSELKYLWNISPPIDYLYDIYKNNLYISLIWIVKSNT